ncbi:hypothetical protein [Actinopolyspora mortivallis]|uniref:hypothetical protein n=1 Tax=Actinopolyspora mortivallis TaxID=33906 RepID=UPI0012EE8DE7|nr:hypothetical protein [Actinopolyspora mortivallis]
MSDRPTIRFLPGIPGGSAEPATNPYPDTALDLMKVMRTHGADVDYSHPPEDRADVAYRSADVWLPVMAFLGSSGLSVGLNILASSIYDLWVRHRQPDRPNPNLHIELQYNDATGERQVRLDGSPDHVIQAIREMSGNADG